MVFGILSFLISIASLNTCVLHQACIVVYEGEQYFYEQSTVRLSQQTVTKTVVLQSTCTGAASSQAAAERRVQSPTTQKNSELF